MRGNRCGGFLALGACLLVIVALEGCKSGKKGGIQPQASAMVEGVDGNFLGAKVSALFNLTYVDMVGTATTVAAKADDAKVREACLLLKLRVSRGIEALRQVQDPRARYVLLWVSLVEMRQEMTTGVNRTLFGSQQQVVVDAILKLELAVQDVGRQVLSEERLDAAVDDVEKMAAEYAVTTGGSGLNVDIDAPLAKARRSSDLDKLLSVPLAPFSGMQGVGDTPSAINNVAKEARAASDMVRRMPEELRWQTEVLLVEAEESGAISQFLRQMQQFQQIGVKLQQTAQQLPKELGDQVERNLKNVAELQPKLNESLTQATAMLQEAKQSIQDGQKLLVTARETSDVLLKTTATYDGAVKETRKLMADISALAGPGPTTAASPAPTTRETGDDGGAWDPVKIQAAAGQLESAAAEIRGLLGDLKSGPSTRPTRLDAAVDRVDLTVDRVESLVNAIAIRAGVLAVLVFLLALAYRKLRAK